MILVCEARGQYPHPHTWICACCKREYEPDAHDIEYCLWERGQRKHYEEEEPSIEHLVLQHHRGRSPGA